MLNLKSCYAFVILIGNLFSFLAEEFSEPESYSSPVKVKKSIPAQQQNEIEPIELDDGYGSPAAPVISAASSSYKPVYKLPSYKRPPRYHSYIT